MKARALDATLAASALVLAALIAARVLVDPEFAYLGGISTGAQGLGYAAGVSTDALNLGYGAGLSTGALPLGYGAGISTSSLPLGYGAGVSTKALGTGYLAGLSTSAKRLGYALYCFIYVNNSWYALKLRARLEDGTPIKVTAKVNGTSYTVPEAGLLLNWTRDTPLCAYVDPIAYVEFPSKVNDYALKGVEGAEGGVAAWPPFTVKEVTAVYSAAAVGQPPSQPGQPPSQPQPGGGGPSAAQPAASPAEEWVGWLLWRLAWAVQALARWLAPLWPWWLLLLAALAALLAYLWWRSRRRFVLVIEVRGW